MRSGGEVIDGLDSLQHPVLLCVHRNHGMGDTSIKFEVIPGKNQKSEYVMTCGKHSVRGWCKCSGAGLR